MKRKAIKQLISWKKKEKKKPFILHGIKGVGKTYISLDFAKSFFDGNLYINFEANAEIEYIFKQNEFQIEKKDFGEIICEQYQIPEELLGSILIILDELQYSPSAYISFLRWVESIYNFSILIVTSEKKSFSGLIFYDYEHLYLYPFDFEEFLIANGYEWYADIILAHSQKNRKIPEIVHKELLSIFDDYLFVGGMPAAINEYFSIESTENVREIHQYLFHHILMTNQNRYTESQALKMNQIFNVIESQILKENHKFQYRFIRKGATYKMFKDAIYELKNNGHILMCPKMIEFNEGLIKTDETIFNLYYFDVGILNTLLYKDNFNVLIPQEQKRKVILENYVIQSLNNKGYEPVFWESNSKAKVDFLFLHKDGLIPIEVRINEGLRSKSLSVFRNLYDIPYCIKLSVKNFEYNNQIKNIPFYALFSL